MLCSEYLIIYLKAVIKKNQSLKFAHEINKSTLLNSNEEDSEWQFDVFSDLTGSLWTFYKTCEAFNASMPGASRPVYLLLLIESIH